MKSAYALLSQLDDVKDKRPPKHLRQPEQVSESRMRIAAAGTWFHDAEPIERPRLVRLFASIMRREADGGYYLITPIEKARVEVEDVPFQDVSMTVNHASAAAQVLSVTTNVAETVKVDLDHELLFRAGRQPEPLPYVHIRDGLEAIFSRAAYYELMDLAELHEVAGSVWYGVRSAGRFWPAIRADAADTDQS